MEEIKQSGAECSEAISEFRFNHTALFESIQFLRENDSQYKDMSVEDIAEQIGLSVSTLKKLKRGEIADPRCSTVWLICQRLDLDARVLLGLAPDRDYRREAETVSATLMEEMRSRMDSMVKQAAVDDSRLVRLREMVLEKGEAMSRAESRCAILQSRIDQQTETIQQHECRLETKRKRIEELGEEIGAHKATIAARDRTIGNLERMHTRQKSIGRGLIAAVCVLALLLASVSTVAAWQMAHDCADPQCEHTQMYNGPD